MEAVARFRAAAFPARARWPLQRRGGWRPRPPPPRAGPRLRARVSWPGRLGASALRPPRTAGRSARPHPSDEDLRGACHYPKLAGAGVGTTAARGPSKPLSVGGVRTSESLQPFPPINPREKLTEIVFNFFRTLEINQRIAASQQCLFKKSSPISVRTGSLEVFQLFLVKAAGQPGGNPGNYSPHSWY